MPGLPGPLMKVALLHYHLKTGGVTTVLRHQLEALEDAAEVLVLVGPSSANIPLDVPVVSIDGLGYDDPTHTSPPVAKIIAAVQLAIRRRFGGPCDLLHVHNPTLAKNRLFLQILKGLQQDGVRLLLQIHDFAEDGRPQAYFPETYPANCHYAVINSRDHNLLCRAGLKTDGVHLLPNRVAEYPAGAEPQAVPEHALYPVRAIRRKNVGEAILLSTLLPSGQCLMITRPPNSPADIAAYKDWKRFVDRLQLRVVFDAGLTRQFADLVRNAAFLLTTSVTEGFGFAFLEPWLSGKFLWGRKLPDICSDFEKRGLQLDHLYLRLQVPLEWIDRSGFFVRWRACIRKNAQRLGHRPTSEAIEAAVETITAGNRIDFGILDEAAQRAVIGRLTADRSESSRLLRMNSWLSTARAAAGDTELIRHNGRVVRDHYGAGAYRERLLRVYERVIRQEVVQQVNKAAVVESFMDLAHFSLLKWGPYGE